MFPSTRSSTGIALKNRVDAFQRWLHLVADEEDAPSMQTPHQTSARRHPPVRDVALVARQVFTELRGDTAFHWLNPFVGQHLHEERRGCVPLGTAFSLLRSAAPHLSGAAIQGVVSSLSSIAEVASRCGHHASPIISSASSFSSPQVRHTAGGSPIGEAPSFGQGGDVSLSHLGVILLGWIASRSCSLVDVVAAHGEIIRSILGAVFPSSHESCPYKDYEDLAAYPCDELPALMQCVVDPPLDDNHLHRWVADRWLQEFCGERLDVCGGMGGVTPPPTQTSSPQRSARNSMHEIAADITPIRPSRFPAIGEIREGTTPLGTFEETDHVLMQSVDRVAVLTAPPHHASSPNGSPGSSTSVRKSAGVDAAATKVLLLQRTRQLLTVLLPHCPSPLLDHMLEECVDELEQENSSTSDASMWSGIDTMMALIHFVAHRWDVGVGAAFSGSYVSSVVVGHFDATRWLVGSEVALESPYIGAANNNSIPLNGSVLSALMNPSVNGVPESPGVSYQPPPALKPSSNENAMLAPTSPLPEHLLLFDGAATTARHQLSDPSKRYEMSNQSIGEVHSLSTSEGNAPTSVSAGRQSATGKTLRRRISTRDSFATPSGTSEAFEHPFEPEGREPPPRCGCGCSVM